MKTGQLAGNVHDSDSDDDDLNRSLFKSVHFLYS